ncbi:hypothetical protein OWV82_020139 [Melia azedarach]|uniref:Uncharacterized protein n=1 Tax=Melia azedarach TaxID=155640 RepID=A0ACC1X4Z6_MELAZ|nr:hypothetical protein OWV82_020139 [Melia azedarach]
MSQTGNTVRCGYKPRKRFGFLAYHPMDSQAVSRFGFDSWLGSGSGYGYGSGIGGVMVVRMVVEICLATPLTVAMVEETVALVVAIAVLVRLMQMLERGTTMDDELVCRLSICTLF